ncbi:MAG: hypothetical protein NC311_16790, partial [Muribaculaceae bacterium]|nr:hypothetical protein [Muribaculaceae bacterium]
MTIYLSGVVIEAEAGKEAVELNHGYTTILHARQGTENRLMGGASAAAVSANARTELAGAGTLVLQAGENGTVTDGGRHFTATNY